MTAFFPKPQIFGGPTVEVRIATGSEKKTYRVNKRADEFLLKEIYISVTVISSLCEVLPCPLSSFLLDFFENGLNSVT